MRLRGDLLRLLFDGKTGFLQTLANKFDMRRFLERECEQKVIHGVIGPSGKKLLLVTLGQVIAVSQCRAVGGDCMNMIVRIGLARGAHDPLYRLIEFSKLYQAVRTHAQHRKSDRIIRTEAPRRVGRLYAPLAVSRGETGPAQGKVRTCKVRIEVDRRLKLFNGLIILPEHQQRSAHGPVAERIARINDDALLRKIQGFSQRAVPIRIDMQKGPLKLYEGQSRIDACLVRFQLERALEELLGALKSAGLNRFMCHTPR